MRRQNIKQESYKYGNGDKRGDELAAWRRLLLFFFVAVRVVMRQNVSQPTELVQHLIRLVDNSANHDPLVFREFFVHPLLPSATYFFTSTDGITVSVPSVIVVHLASRRQRERDSCHPSLPDRAFNANTYLFAFSISRSCFVHVVYPPSVVRATASDPHNAAWLTSSPWRRPNTR